MTVPVLILGAGLTGLSCAYHLAELSRYRLIERESSIGGLAKTTMRAGGFQCDGTGHWLHLRTDYARSMVESLLDGNLAVRERRARIYSKGIFTAYPFQANTFGLPSQVIADCLLGFIKATCAKEIHNPKNYLEWIRSEFGEGICKHFLEPYNRKIYGVPLDTLATDFAAKYVPRPSIETVVNGALGLSAEALGYNASFVYPTRGGIGALAKSIHQRLNRKAECGREPIAINLIDQTARMVGGESIHFERLVSTIPLPDLVNLCQAGNGSSVPDAVLLATKRLRANSVLYFDIGIRGEPKPHQNYHWIYLPDPSLPFYRVGSYSAVEPALAPPGHRSYYVELGHFGDVDPSKFEEPVLRGLRELGILEDDNKILFMIPNVISPAYVLFDQDYERSRRTVLSWLTRNGVISVGRYGRWQYNAMEDALLEGKEAAEILSGKRSLDRDHGV
jgi:protoporphyrinogen oxidase